MAKVLFATGPLGAIVLPLMLFHQMQLMVCAVLAQRYANRQRAAQAGRTIKAGAAKPALRDGKPDNSANAGAGR